MTTAFPNEKTASIEERLALVEGRLEIEAVLADYCIGIDDRDPDRWLSAFHEDADFDVDLPPTLCHGHREILEWTRGAWRFKMLNHLSTNHKVEFVDQDNANGIAHAIAFFRLEDGTTTLGTARYTDRYARRNGHWRIAYRQVKIVGLARLDNLHYLIFNGSPVAAQ